MKSGLSATLGASASVIGTCLFAASAMAQQAPVEPAKADGLQEIVVTANRVESSAQKTSIALTVYSGADLAAKGVTNVMSLAAVDPSINVTTSNGAELPRPTSPKSATLRCRSLAMVFTPADPIRSSRACTTCRASKC